MDSRWASRGPWSEEDRAWQPDDHGRTWQYDDYGRAQPLGSGPRAPGRRTGAMMLQARGDLRRADPAVPRAAERGLGGSPGELPHLHRIQAAFGRHDVAAVRAHVGGPASDACDEIGAEAYATGGAVAFARAPDLHTAAHEAAHVVQQRAGVSLKGGVGEVGDPYERHADEVADAVVAGRSAETILDRGAGGGGGVGVQMQRGRRGHGSAARDEAAACEAESAETGYELSGAAAAAGGDAAAIQAEADALYAQAATAVTGVSAAASEVLGALNAWRATVDDAALAHLETSENSVIAHGTLAIASEIIEAVTEHNPLAHGIYQLIHGAIEVGELIHELHEVAENRELVAAVHEGRELAGGGGDSIVDMILREESSASSFCGQAYGWLGALLEMSLRHDVASAGERADELAEGCEGGELRASAREGAASARGRLDETLEAARNTLELLRQGVERMAAAANEIRTRGRQEIVRLQAAFARGGEGDEGPLRLEGTLTRGSSATLYLHVTAAMGEEAHHTEITPGARLSDFAALGQAVSVVLNFHIHDRDVSEDGVPPLTLNMAAGGAITTSGPSVGRLGWFARPIPDDGRVEYSPPAHTDTPNLISRGRDALERIEQIIWGNSLSDLQTTDWPVSGD